MTAIIETAEQVKGLYFPVLNEGFVSLKDYMGGDAAVVEAARVSYGAGTRRVTDDRGLLRYLMSHNHSTPFEMVELKFHVKLPIFVARQLIRHRTASVNEYSLRYSLAPLQFYRPDLEYFCYQSTENRQGRALQVDQETYARLMTKLDALHQADSDFYVEEIVEDIARELARCHLPLTLYTEWYWKIDLHNLFGFLKLRRDGHAQREIQDYAHVKACLARLVAPLAFEAWVDYRFCARSFSRMELIALAEMYRGAVEGSDRTDTQRLLELGLTQREVAAFIEKTSGAPEVPDFTLPFDSARGAEHFRLRAASAVPVIPSK